MPGCCHTWGGPRPLATQDPRDYKARGWSDGSQEPIVLCHPLLCTEANGFFGRQIQYLGTELPEDFLRESYRKSLPKGTFVGH